MHWQDNFSWIGIFDFDAGAHDCEVSSSQDSKGYLRGDAVGAGYHHTPEEPLRSVQRGWERAEPYNHSPPTGRISHRPLLSLLPPSPLAGPREKAFPRVSTPGSRVVISIKKNKEDRKLWICMLKCLMMPNAALPKLTNIFSINWFLTICGDL